MSKPFTTPPTKVSLSFQYSDMVGRFRSDEESRYNWHPTARVEWDEGATINGKAYGTFVVHLSAHYQHSPMRPEGGYGTHVAFDPTND